MVPHLVTALKGPINELEQRILESTPVIERWFRLEWMEHTPPFYSAVDIRNAGFKLAPTDTHLFPSGWHHLTPEMQPLAVQAAMAAIEKICPEAKNLLLVPQSTLDPFYLSNLAQLQRIFFQAGLNVRLGSLSNDIKEPTRIELPSGESVLLEPLIRSKRRLGLKHFDPCTILLNNDLSAGVPGILEDLHEQYLLPPLHAAWPTRRRHQHFAAYEEIAKRFGKLLGMDHWLITPIVGRAEGLALDTEAGLAGLVAQADAVLLKVRRKYKEYGIGERPFVQIRPNQGVAGDWCWSVHDSKELAALVAASLAAHNGAKKGAKAGLKNGASKAPTDWFFQEGLVTHERINGAMAEPVVSLVDRYVVGGYYRINAERGRGEVLTGSEVGFVPLAFEQSAQLPQPGIKPGQSVPNRFYMYGVIGRLAMLAASYELEATDPDAESYE